MWTEILTVLAAASVCSAKVEVTLIADVELDYNKCSMTTGLPVHTYMEAVFQQVFCRDGRCQEDIHVELQGCRRAGRIHHTLTAALRLSCLQSTETTHLTRAIQGLVLPYVQYNSSVYKELTDHWPVGLVSAQFNVTCPKHHPACLQKDFACDAEAAAASRRMTAGAVAGVVLGSLAGLAALAGAAAALAHHLQRRQTRVDSLSNLSSLGFFATPDVPGDKTANIRFTPR